MANLFNRYIWIVDTINRYGRITRNDLSDLWLRSELSDGRPLPRRTFFNYRAAILELFGLNIEIDPSTYEYYIDGRSPHSDSVTAWLLNSAAIGNIVGAAADIASRIFVEEVPSARHWLSTIIQALKEGRQVRFDYLPYTRLNPTRGIVLEPYFLKIFRQRWYITGRVVADGAIKTYALDRMNRVTIEATGFTMPADFDPEEYCRDTFGIIFTKGAAKDVALKVDSRQAKYLRALPLHTSQQEVIHDSYSIFHYRLKLTGDLIEQLLSMGSRVTVLAPAELRAMVVSELHSALSNYQQ